MSIHHAVRVFPRRSHRFGVPCALLLFLFASLPAVAAPWSLAGRVLDGCSTPAAGATVTVTLSSGATYGTQTDGGGYYVLGGDAQSPVAGAVWAQHGTLTSPVYNFLDQDITMNLTLTGCQP